MVLKVWRLCLPCLFSWETFPLTHAIYPLVLIHALGKGVHCGYILLSCYRDICSYIFLMTCIHLIFRKQFGKLGRMIGNHPRLKESSRFLFIPGPDDAGTTISITI